MLIIIFIIYFTIGCVKYYIETEKSIPDQAGWVRDGKSIKYVLLWPIAMLTNDVATYMIQQAKKESQYGNYKSQNDFTNYFSFNEKRAIIHFLSIVATDFGQSRIDPSHDRYINSLSNRFGIETKYFTYSESQKIQAQNDIIAALKSIAHNDKILLAKLLAGLLYNPKQRSRKQLYLAALIIEKIGISSDDFSLILTDAFDRMDNF